MRGLKQTGDRLEVSSRGADVVLQSKVITLATLRNSELDCGSFFSIVHPVTTAIRLVERAEIGSPARYASRSSASAPAEA